MQCPIYGKHVCSTFSCAKKHYEHDYKPIPYPEQSNIFTKTKNSNRKLQICKIIAETSSVYHLGLGREGNAGPVVGRYFGSDVECDDAVGLINTPLRGVNTRRANAPCWA